MADFAVHMDITEYKLAVRLLCIAICILLYLYILFNEILLSLMLNPVINFCKSNFKCYN